MDNPPVSVGIGFKEFRHCLVSDGFETKAGMTDKAIPILSEKFAIHTSGLGCVETFGGRTSGVGLMAVQRVPGSGGLISGFSACWRF
jgi:hypothetical protein